MRVRVTADTSELRNLVVDISGAPARIQFGARKRLNQGRRMVEREMKVDAGGHRFLRHLPKAVTSEMIDPWTAEIGLAPRKGTQGALAHIIVYGSVNNAPVYDHTAGLRRAEPRIEQAFADEAEDDVLGGRK